MKYYVKAFYPEHSFKNGQAIGCILYINESKRRADKVRDNLRSREGRARGLYFTHDENGRGATKLETYDLTK